MKAIKPVVFFLYFIVLSGCAGKLANQKYEDQKIPDPYESINRTVYKANVAIDLAITRPIATGYKKVTPNFFRDRFSDFLRNLNEPRNFINNILQLKVEQSVTSLARFTINSTFGLGGFIDIMTPAGEPAKPEDFGQTLAYWGAKPGAYLMLPILGPSSVRDTVGRIGDFLMLSPNKLIEDPSGDTAYTVFNIIETRADLLPLDPVLKRQIDVYNFLKSGYEQSRINNVFDGNAPEEEEDF